jgi:hypothetical protein
MHYHAEVQVHTLRAHSYAPTSEIRTSVVSVLLLAGNKNAKV